MMSPRYGYGMYPQQTTKMHMTLQMQQAVRILQLSTPDLLEYVRQELEANPLLEVPDLAWKAGTPRAPEFDPLNLAADDQVSLERHLKEQLGFVKNIPGTVKRAVIYMIGNLDGNGYLEMSLEQIANALQIERQQAEQALNILHGFDPPGVGARNLAECLLLQVNAASGCPGLVLRLIAGDLEDIAEMRIPKLAKLLNATREQVEEAIDFIKRLDPRPGASYQPADTRYIVPDVIIEKTGDHYEVSVQEMTAPRLSIHEHYRRMAHETGKTGETGKFLGAKLQTAAFLIRCLEQRRVTLWRVTRAIVEEQEEFFRGGIAYLKPMILKQIADKLNLHESTISRAVAGKYAQTPRGTYELGFFFPSGVNRGREDAASAQSVKERIKEWVKRENHDKPYSDQQLTVILAEEGIPIARRTVMKYREELGIGCSVRRKRKILR